MPVERILLSLLTSEPLVPAALLFLGIVIVTRSWRSAPAPLSARALALSRLIKGGAVAVIVVDAGVRLLPIGLARLPRGAGIWARLAPGDYQWWAFLLPIVVTLIILGIALWRLRAERTSVEMPVVPVIRRNWLSFSKRSEAIAAAITGGVLLVLSVLSGLASVTDRNGLHTLIVIPGGELEHPVDPSTLPDGANVNATSSFFGWAYGLPVIVATLVLAVIAYMVLRTDAARPFVRPEEVAGDTAGRQATAAGVWRLSSAALALTLGAALAIVASAGLSSSGVGIPGVGTFIYSLGYSAFAPAMFWISVLIRIVAILALLLLVRGHRERPVRMRSTALPVQP